MPQPLSNLLPKKGPFSIMVGTSIAGERPDQAAMMMRVISIWSYTDLKLAHMMSAFLDSEFEIVTEMLVALSSSEGKRAAINAAARHALSDADFQLYQAVMKVTKSSRERRNEYAHHIWGTATHLPDAVLLIDPRHLARHEAKLQAAPAKARPLKAEDLPIIDYNQVFVFRTADIERDIRDAEMAQSHILNLQSVLADHPSAAEMRTKLFADPLIRQALQPKSP